MADTALAIIQDSLQQAKIYAPGVFINSSDSTLMLRLLNKMLDEWSNESLICFANLEQSFPLVPGQNSYTIGTGGNINAPRPLTILTGMGAAYLMDSNANRYPVNVIEQDQWNTIGLLTETSQLPDTLFYNPQYPLGIINVFPTPLTAYTMYFDARLQLADLSNLTTQFSLPPGYMEAISNNLTIKAWPYFKTGDPPGILMKLADDSLAKVKRSNIRQSPSTYDSSVVSRATGAYNIYSDNSNRGGA
jgi:hypothetical protein